MINTMKQMDKTIATLYTDMQLAKDLKKGFDAADNAEDKMAYIEAYHDVKDEMELMMSWFFDLWENGYQEEE